MLRLQRLAFAATLTLGAGTASSAIVGFEDLAVSPGGNFISGDLVSSGFNFDSSANHLHRSNNAFSGNSGSTFLVIDDFDGSNVLTMTQVGGAAFSLSSMGLGEWNPGGGLASAVTVTGLLAGGGTVQTTFSLDGVVSDGTTNNFQTFNFGSGWSNLLGVQFDATAGTGSSYWALDNISVGAANAAVPEPATLALVGLSLAGLAVTRRGSRKP